MLLAYYLAFKCYSYCHFLNYRPTITWKIYLLEFYAYSKYNVCVVIAECQNIDRCYNGCMILRDVKQATDIRIFQRGAHISHTISNGRICVK